MALVIKDRVKETTTSTGTGSITLAGAEEKYVAFGSVLSNSDTVYYAIEHSGSGVDEWEVGIGTYTSSTDSISRDTILSSSNSGSAVNFSVGTKTVFATYPADKAIYEDASGNVDVSGNITVGGTVDGRDLATDGTKLDAIESGATADQTAAEIKTAYESNSDTNAFTDSEKTKLAGIEASADVTDTTNVTAAGALMDSEVTNLAQVKAFDSSDYATAAQGTTADAALARSGGTMTGAITFAAGQTFDGRDVSADGSKLDGIESGATADQTASEILTAIKTVDGSASGLDADLLDGQQGSYYTGYTDTAIANLVDTAPSTLDTLNELAAALGDDPNFSTTVTNNIATKLPLAGGTMTGTITFASGQTFDGRDVSADGTKLDGIESGATADQTKADIDALNIDADTVDGVHANKFFTSYNNAGTTGWEDTNRNFRVNSGGNAVGLVMHESDGTFGLQLYGDGSRYGFLDANWGGWDIQKTINGEFKVDEGAGLQRVFNDAWHPNADKWTTARTLSLSGDASGSVSWDGSANATLSVTVANDSHTHDGRYYTESEADSRFVNVTGDTMTGDLLVQDDIKSTGQIRATGWWNSNTGTTGDDLAVEIGVSSSQGYILSYSRATSSYGALNLSATSISTNQRPVFNGNTAFDDGYHPNADKWTTARTLSLSGDASGSVSWDGSANATLSVSVGDADTVDGLQASSFIRSDADDNVSGHTEWQDTYQIRLGNSADTRLWHNGAHTYIRSYKHGQGIYFQQEDSGGTNRASLYLEGSSAPYVRLFQAGAERLRTVSTGVDVTGSLDVSGSVEAGTLTLSSSASDTLNFSADSTDNNRGVAFNGRIAMSADYNDGFLRLNNASEFTNGIYTPANFRADGWVEAGSGIRHQGDNNTNVTFGTDTVTIQAGGSSEITVNTTGVRLGDTGNGYFQPVSGNYGSIQIDGGAHGGYEGYSIGGRVVLMHDNGSNTGIYNDVNNEWLFYGVHNGLTRMYFNGSAKLDTTSTGITVSGDVNSTSDIRYKKNIEPIENAVEKVQALRGVTFDWDNDAFKEDETTKKPNFTERATGVIAQEVEKVLPEAVRENETTGFKNVAYGNMVGLLIEAIKEQQTQIDALKAEIEVMKS